MPCYLRIADSLANIGTIVFKAPFIAANPERPGLFDVADMAVTKVALPLFATG